MRNLLKLSTFFLLLLIAGLGTAVKAERVANLYSASWPVSNQSEAVRQVAMKNVFAEVLVRVSGSQSVLSHPAIEAALGEAQRYMRQYSYKRLSAAEQMVYEKPLLLVASFDGTSVQKMLQEAGLPVWSENRPLGAFWIAVEEANGRQVATDSQDDTVIYLKGAANRRGLPVVLPLMDLEDKSLVRVGDIWGRFTTPISHASKRYAADYVVAGQLAQANGQWYGRWSVDFGGSVDSISSSGDSKQAVVSDLVNQVADKLASRLAVVLSDKALTVEILVEDIGTLEAYAEVQSYLSGLGMTDRVTPIQIRADSVLFEVKVFSSPQNLIDAIEIGNNLQRIPSDTIINGRYQFRWRD